MKIKDWARTEAASEADSWKLWEESEETPQPSLLLFAGFEDDWFRKRGHSWTKSKCVIKVKFYQLTCLIKSKCDRDSCIEKWCSARKEFQMELDGRCDACIETFLFLSV